MRTSKYILPENLYMQTLYTIRNYYYLKDSADAVLDKSPAPPDGQPRGTQIGNPTEEAAINREYVLKVTKAIEDAFAEIPKEYQRGVRRNIIYRCSYPMDADRTTYSRYKSKFIFTVANSLYLE